MWWWFYGCILFSRFGKLYTFLFILLSSLLSHIHSCYFSILYLCTSQSASLIVYRTATYLSKDPERSMTHQSVQSLSRVRLFVTPWIAARQASLSITNFRSSLTFISIESEMPSSHLILCHPLLLLPPIPPSISLFQWVNSSHEVAKVLEFQL